MIPFHSVLKFASASQQCSPSFLSHFHHVYIRNIFLFTFCLSLTQQIFGQAIICNHQQHRIPTNYLEWECFINGTFTKRDGTTIIYHPYYQWISVIFLLQAFAFWLPFQMVWGVWFREFNHEKTMNVDIILDEIQRSGRKAFWKTFGMETIYLFHLIGQGVLMDMIFNQALSKGGLTWPEIFPNKGTCHVDYYSGSGITTGKFICLLPLNILYQKIFLALFIGFWILFTIHVMIMISRIVMVFCPFLRKGPFREDLNRWWFAQIMKRNLTGLVAWEFENVTTKQRREEDCISRCQLPNAGGSVKVIL